MENVLLGAAVLACPVGMGLMMWFMGRGKKRGRPSVPPEGPESLGQQRGRLPS
jgi:hypothetical protein